MLNRANKVVVECLKQDKFEVKTLNWKSQWYILIPCLNGSVFDAFSCTRFS